MTIARYAVFGNPVAHSQSPTIHQMFAAQEGIDIVYEKIFAADEQAFITAVNAFFEQGGCGANITVPFKAAAWSWVQQHTARAHAAGAVNTLIPLDNHVFCGDNTDGEGLVQDIQEHLHFSLNNKKVLIVGAGGATRGVILPLLAQQPHSITLTNRTHQKAQDLAAHFNLSAIPLAKLAQHVPFDVVINATSSGLHGDAPALPTSVLAQCALAYDMVYGSRATPFMQMAQQAGAQCTADGLGMLVCQAAVSYQLWRSFTPNTAPVLAAMRTQLSL